jgi:hypothetical protein
MNLVLLFILVSWCSLCAVEATDDENLVTDSLIEKIQRLETENQEKDVINQDLTNERDELKRLQGEELRKKQNLQAEILRLEQFKIAGDWSSWGDWSTCSSSGVRERTRRCDNPAPSCGGPGCVGNETDTASCNEHPCGGLLVFGGWTSGDKFITASVESVPGSVPCSVPDLPTPVTAHSTTVTPSGMVLSCGGYTYSRGCCTSSCVSWTPGTSDWSTAPADLPREMEDGVLLTVGDTIIWSGGMDADTNIYRDIYRWQLQGYQTGGWQKVNYMSEKRAFHCGVSFRGRAILIGGLGNKTSHISGRPLALTSVEEFPSSTTTSLHVPYLHTERMYHACTLYTDNTGRPNILVSGGFNPRDKQEVPSVERSTFLEDEYFGTFSLMERRLTVSGHTMVPAGNKILILQWNEIWESEDNGDTWNRSSKNLTISRQHHTSVSTDLLNC